MMHLPFRYLEPTFFSGLFDDPILLIKARPLGRSVLFDCGQMHHLAKRVFKSIDAVFITHTHMDHFMGLDSLIRNVHVSPTTIDLFGPPGLTERVQHKLSAYTWNLCENYWCTFRIHEVFEDRIKSSLSKGAKGFVIEQEDEQVRTDAVIYENRYLRVEARQGDHKVPVLFFRLTEKSGFGIDESRLKKARLVRGPWLEELRSQFYSNTLGKTPLTVLMHGSEKTAETQVSDTKALYDEICHLRPDATIGYMTDLGFSEKNIQKIQSLMTELTLLVCECAFLRSDVERARASYHFCAEDLNNLLHQLHPHFVLPMHLSKSYIGSSEQLYKQLKLPKRTHLLRLPEHLPPRPLFPEDIQWTLL